MVLDFHVAVSLLVVSPMACSGLQTGECGELGAQRGAGSWARVPWDSRTPTLQTQFQAGLAPQAPLIAPAASDRCTARRRAFLHRGSTLASPAPHSALLHR